jgi:SAM-dependent methyltransferase
MVGVDVSSQAVAFCRQRHDVPGLLFEVGDAGHLAFGPASFDAVPNIESSHCYGDSAAFLAEVRRVLRPDGYFLYAISGRASHSTSGVRSCSPLA